MTEAYSVEPQLEAMPGSYAGAVYSESDEVADARAFTEGLTAWLQNHRSVKFKMGTEVLSLQHQNAAVHGVRTVAGDVSADAVVVCAGSWSEVLLKPLLLSADIYPVRGYSVTLPLGKHVPHVSITDYERKIVLSRLHDQIRIAGFADFVGFDTSRDASRVNTLLQTAKDVAPYAADYDGTITSGWGGLRPMTPNGQPRVGSTTTRNLFLNTGHGMFGWTLACASGYDLSAAIGRYYDDPGNKN